MTFRHFGLCCLWMGIVLAAACAKSVPPALPPITIAPAAEPPVQATVTIAISPDANPDASGRPSPVSVRVYQLKADAAFSGAEFFDVWDDEQKVLGESLIKRDEYFLKSGERRTVEVLLPSDAAFLGVVAELRDIRNTKWRTLLAAPSGRMTVTVDKAGVSVSAAQ